MAHKETKFMKGKKIYNSKSLSVYVAILAKQKKYIRKKKAGEMLKADQMIGDGREDVERGSDDWGGRG